MLHKGHGSLFVLPNVAHEKIMGQMCSVGYRALYMVQQVTWKKKIIIFFTVWNGLIV